MRCGSADGEEAEAFPAPKVPTRVGGEENVARSLGMRVSSSSSSGGGGDNSAVSATAAAAARAVQLI